MISNMSWKWYICCFWSIIWKYLKVIIGELDWLLAALKGSGLCRKEIWRRERIWGEATQGVSGLKGVREVKTVKHGWGTGRQIGKRRCGWFWLTVGFYLYCSWSLTLVLCFLWYFCPFCKNFMVQSLDIHSDCCEIASFFKYMSQITDTDLILLCGKNDQSKF